MPSPTRGAARPAGTSSFLGLVHPKIYPRLAGGQVRFWSIPCQLSHRPLTLPEHPTAALQSLVCLHLRLPASEAEISQLHQPIPTLVFHITVGHPSREAVSADAVATSVAPSPLHLQRRFFKAWAAPAAQPPLLSNTPPPGARELFTIEREDDGKRNNRPSPRRSHASTRPLCSPPSPRRPSINFAWNSGPLCPLAQSSRR